MTGLVAARYNAGGMQEDDLYGKSFVVTTPITISRAIIGSGTGSDAERLIPVANGINLTLNAGLPLTFNCMFTPPATGNFTLTPGSGVTINGGTAVLTFTRAGGVVAITPTETLNVFRASGGNV